MCPGGAEIICNVLESDKQKNTKKYKMKNCYYLDFIENYSVSLNRLREIYQRKGHEVASINPLEPPKAK